LGNSWASDFFSSPLRYGHIFGRENLDLEILRDGNAAATRSECNCLFRTVTGITLQCSIELPPVKTALFILAFCSVLLAEQTNSTEPVECSEVPKGKAVTRQTPRFSTDSGSIRAYVLVRLSRPEDDLDARSCTVLYSFFVSDQGKTFVLVKKHSQLEENLVGAQIVGVSKNQRILAADFWWAAGDYTGHRPVVYNRRTKAVAFRALDDQITKQLPSCDYFEDFVGITDQGEALIEVPKSIYVDTGCPAQGVWAFDLRSGKATRLAKTSSSER